jgi:ubiquinone/menaquinone biosynthesis C-methylase UbiE
MGLAEGLLKTMGRQARKPSGCIGKMVYGHMATWGHRPLTRWTIEFLDVQPADCVLDVGCGGGMAIQLLAEIAMEGFVAGVDHSADMVQQTRKRNAAAIQAGRVEVKHGNVAALPYDDASFDKVIAVETFYFWANPVEYLQEVRRVLQPGRLVALAMEASKEAPNWQKMAAQTAQMGFPIYSGVEVEEMLTAAGFSRAWFETVPDKGSGWLCALGVK